MREIITTTNKNMSDERHPVHMRDIEPLAQGVMAHWGNLVVDVSIRIFGSITDWVNQCGIRSQTSIPLCSANSDLCAAMALVGLRNMYRSKFAIGLDVAFSTWRNGSSITGAPRRPCCGLRFLEAVAILALFHFIR